MLGSFEAEIKYGENKETLSILVFKGKDSNLMDQDNLGKLYLNLGKFTILWVVKSIAS